MNVTQNTVFNFIDCAEAHGEKTGKDQEVGDLQAFVRAAWEMMTPEMRVAFVASPTVKNIAKDQMNAIEYDSIYAGD